MAMNPNFPDPFIYVPKRGDPQLLFVLLHGESAGPDQLFSLAQAIKQAFPLALVVLPYAFEIEPGSTHDKPCHHWVDPVGLDEGNYVRRVEQALPLLIKQIQQIQAQYGLTGERTALAGFSQGACMALEASLAQPNLAGRVLAFSGLYASGPVQAPPATLLHFFHGAEDNLVSSDRVHFTLERLAELQGDATLDEASGVGHELHPALIHQAVVRLQTCVPLRNWEAALGALQAQASDAPDIILPDSSGRTLH